jgi:hypothetical protein
MKVGDLVILSSRKTRRGIGYEDKVGIVLKVAINNVVAVSFEGMRVYLGVEDLQVISEVR